MNAEARPGKVASSVGFLGRHPWLTSGFIIVLCTLAFYIAVEWRAELRWRRYAAEARARGTKLHRTDFVWPPIQPEENFAELPLLKIPLKGKALTPPLRLPSEADFPHKRPGDDWNEWREYFHDAGFLADYSDDPVRDVARALDHYAPQIQQWREWSRTRTQCQLSDVSDVQEMVFSNLREASTIFLLRLRAHLALRDSAEACSDFENGMQVCRALSNDPFGWSQRYRVVLMDLLLSSLGAGLRDHCWAEPELKNLDANLAVIRPWEDYCFALGCARCSFNEGLEESMNTSIRERIHAARGLLDAQQGRMEMCLELLTRSVFRDNELRLNRYCDEMAVPSAARGQTFDPDRPRPSAPRNTTGSFNREYYSLSVMGGETYPAMEYKYIKLQISLDEARLAVALERFRRARGAFPQALAELVPEFLPALPIDVYAHAPYHYRRIGATSFQLYSVGVTREDDGQPPPSALWPFSPVEVP
jgi:hypothetical protein